MNVPTGACDWPWATVGAVLFVERHPKRPELESSDGARIVRVIGWILYRGVMKPKNMALLLVIGLLMMPGCGVAAQLYSGSAWSACSRAVAKVVKAVSSSRL